MDLANTSNLEILEKYIENKINQLFDVLPPNPDIKIQKMIYEYTVYELYQGTIQTAIDIINDLTSLNTQNMSVKDKAYRKQIFDIFFADHRKLFVGIIMIIFSFILYFIDGASI